MLRRPMFSSWQARTLQLPEARLPGQPEDSPTSTRPMASGTLGNSPCFWHVKAKACCWSLLSVPSLCHTGQAHVFPDLLTVPHVCTWFYPFNSIVSFSSLWIRLHPLPFNWKHVTRDSEARDRAELAQFFPSMHAALGAILASQTLSAVVHIRDPSIWKEEAGGLGGQSHPQLASLEPVWDTWDLV